MFELLNRDAAGRLCKLSIGEYTRTTPNIAVVVNPNRQLLPISLIKQIGAELIITNSYIIHKNPDIRKQFSKKGLHKTLGWKGPIMSDSGTFQMYSQKIKNLDNKKIVKFQKKIKSDVITPVDMFTLPGDDYKTAKKKLVLTNKRLKETKNLVKGDWSAPIQGGRHLDLRIKACRFAAKLEPSVFAIGGIVPYMEQYKFSKLCEIIVTCKKNLPSNTPIHAFGAGHPMVFSLLVALGCDLFDSAMYSLAARRGAYLTTRGTLLLKNIKEFPCVCPACSTINPKNLKKSSLLQIEKFLTLHNLYVTLGEIKTIRQAIRQERLWELVQQRCRSHPELLKALSTTLHRFGKDLIQFERVSKSSALFYSGSETKNRPEVLRAQEWKKRLSGKKMQHKFFGPVAAGLKDTYPFGQSITFGKPKYPAVSPIVQLRAILNYQFGKGAARRFSGIRIETSRKTNRLRRVWKNKKLLGTIRAYDGLFIPTLKGAKLLGKHIKKVHVDDKEVAGFISIGRNLFAKFVSKCDNIFPGEEVAIIHNKKLIATGTTLLNREETLSFKRGVAVKIR